MDERNLLAEKPGPRLLVDELSACGCELLQSRSHVVRLERDVVHPWAAPRKESPDRGVVARRREQLDPAVSDTKQRSHDSLRRESATLFDVGSEDALVRRDRLLEVDDCDAEMVDPPHVHPRDATRRRAGAAQSRAGRARTVPIVSDEWDSA